MAVGFRPGVSFCEASGHLVFLDLEADRYFGLQRTAEEAFRRWSADANSANSPSEDEWLYRSGLLVETPEPGPICPCAPPPTPVASLFDRDLPPVTCPALVGGVTELLYVHLYLRLRGLAPTIRMLTAGKARLAGAAGESRDAVAQAAALFRQCGLILRSYDQCLVCSIALTRHLALRGVAADFVIGVQIRPFSAHAWVQRDGLILNESCDGVRGYTPILVV
jgi:hypothetical protein